MNTGDNVKDFMRACGQYLHEERDPALTLAGYQVESEQRRLYLKLIGEEYMELVDACLEHDPVAIADAVADLVWVIEGFAHTVGVPLQAVWDEVARSNMSKIPADGKVLRRADGKIQKPDSYSPPDVARVLFG